MKVLFAVRDDNISNAIKRDYQIKYKEIISSKSVYYFDAIVNELRMDKTYDRIIISEDLQPLTSNNYEAIDSFIFEKLDDVTDEAATPNGEDIPIILICADRRNAGEDFMNKIFGIGIYCALLGNDRNTYEVCDLIYKPRNKKEAKFYYRMNSGSVDYITQAEGDVNESEIQNIINYYRKIQGNQAKYVEAFNKIATQYNNQQLKVIISFLPQDVRRVLQVSCSKYQEVVESQDIPMEQVDDVTKKTSKPLGSSFDVNKKKQETIDNSAAGTVNNQGIRVSSIKGAESENKPVGPVIIPTSMKFKNNAGPVQKPVVPQPVQQPTQIQQQPVVQVPQQPTEQPVVQQVNPVQAAMQAAAQVQKANPVIPVQQPEPIVEEPTIDDSIVNEQIPEETTPISVEPEEDFMMPGFDDEPVEEMPVAEEQVVTTEPEEEFTMPGFEEEPVVEDQNQDVVASEEDFVMPGFEEEPVVEDTQTTVDNSEQDDGFVMPGFEEEPVVEEPVQVVNELEEDEQLPVFGDETFEEQEEIPMPTDYDNLVDETVETEPVVENEQMAFDDMAVPVDNTSDDTSIVLGEPEETDDSQIQNIGDAEALLQKLRNKKKNDDYDVSNIVEMLTHDKKIVAFVGTTQNGTSFLINNTADILSKMGIKTCIVDLTKNRNSYFIYTDNDEALRNKAYTGVQKLMNGEYDPITVNQNLDVYTSLPGERNEIDEYKTILPVLLKKYKLILLDCDFETNYGYIAACQELYLVQNMDVLTIQPLTGYLKELQTKKILDRNKLRIVINKYVRVKGIKEQTIIGGMACYNDPSMSYMSQLFNRETIKYTVVPFDPDAYSKYLAGLFNCKIDSTAYSREFQQYLRRLASMVYPITSLTTYNTNQKQGFSANVNNTLRKMKGSN